MKHSGVFIAALVVVMLVIIIIEAMTPRRFSWQQTYAHTSDEPFGCALVDSLLAASLPNGYEVSPKSFAQIRDDSGFAQKHTFLVVNRQFDDYNHPLQGLPLLELAERGHNVVIATTALEDDTLSHKLGVSILYDTYFSVRHLKNSYSEALYLNLKWCPSLLYDDTCSWQMPDAVPSSFVSAKRDQPMQVFVTRTYSDFSWTVDERIDYEFTDTVAASISYGRGTIVLVAIPAIFSNFGFVSCGTASLAMRLLSPVADVPVVRINPSERAALTGKSESVLRGLLERPPLRWALYAALIGVLLAMIFTARRRQRVIPVIKPPANVSLEMVRHIGSLYFQRHDNADLLAKKFAYFTEEVRKLTLIDVDDATHRDDNALLLSQRSGLDRDEIKQNLHSIGLWIDSGEQPANLVLMRSIDFMNNLIKKLS